MGVKGDDPATLLAMVEEALVRHQEAILEVERLLEGPHTPAELAVAHRRVEGLAAATEGLLARLAQLVPPERRAPFDG